jgi:hypothetical protein
MLTYNSRVFRKIDLVISCRGLFPSTIVVGAFIGRKYQRQPRPREAQPAAQPGQAANYNNHV